MWYSRVTSGQVLYCQASQRSHGMRGRSRNRPLKCATNDQSGGRPAISMNVKIPLCGSWQSDQVSLGDGGG